MPLFGRMMRVFSCLHGHRQCQQSCGKRPVAGMPIPRPNDSKGNAIAKRWTQYFKAIPELDEMAPEQVSRAQEILSLQERRRLEAIIASTAAARGD